jgi:hypothetical protein
MKIAKRIWIALLIIFNESFRIFSGKRPIMTEYRLKTPWPETLADFEKYLCQTGKSSQTIKAYSHTLNVFARFCQNELQRPAPYVSQLRENDFKSFIGYLRSTRHLAESSITRHLAGLLTFLRYDS